MTHNTMQQKRYSEFYKELADKTLQDELKFEHSHNSKNGAIIEEFSGDVLKGYVIPGLTEDSGQIKLGNLQSISFHSNLLWYRISHPKFGSFYASADHSLVAFDYELKKYVRISPAKILENPYRYYFVRIKNYQELLEALDKGLITLQQFEEEIAKNENREFVPASEFEIKFVGNYPELEFNTKGIDFTILETKTFALANGIIVYDTMAIYTPITEEGQRDAYRKMFLNFLHPAGGNNALSPNQDSILGVYMLTKDEPSEKGGTLTFPKDTTFKEVYDVLANEKDATIRVEYQAPPERGGQKIVTTLGRLAYNLALPPEAFRDDNGFFNGVVRKKVMRKHFDNIVLYSEINKIAEAWDNIVKLAKLGELLYPVSIGLEELNPPKEIIDQFKQVVNNPKSTPQDILNAIDKVMEQIKEWLKKSHAGFYYLIDSGARGGWDDIRQMLVAKGFVVDPQGRIIKEVIASGYVEGLTPKDFFKAAPAWIKGSMDRSVNTAEPGYITRQLIMALATSAITKDDCGSNRYLEVELTKDNYQAFLWRYTDKGELLTPANIKQYIGQTVKLRTPIFCKSEQGICAKCYGEFYKLAKTKEVGILAAQSLGERGTQLIMKTFHTGGAAEKFEIPIVVKDDNPVVKQVGDWIIAKELPVTIVFNAIDSEFTYEEDMIFYKGGAIYVYRGEFYDDSELPAEPDFVLPVDGLSYGVEILVESPENVNITEYNFLNIIKKDKQIMQLILVSPDISNMLKYIKQLLGGKLTKTWRELLELLWKYYTFNFGQLSIHAELVVASMCRNKENPVIPMRRKPDEPYIIAHIKDVPYLESPLLGLAFENMSKAILFATLGGYKEYEGISALEKIISGSFDKNLSIKEFLERL